MNGEGKEMSRWLDETRSGIVNGCTRGDEERNYTYIGAKRHTIIDYVVINMIEHGKEKRIEVKTMTGSDHMAIKYEWEEEITGEEEEYNEKDAERKK